MVEESIPKTQPFGGWEGQQISVMLKNEIDRLLADMTIEALGLIMNPFELEVRQELRQVAELVTGSLSVILFRTLLLFTENAQHAGVGIVLMYHEQLLNWHAASQVEYELKHGGRLGVHPHGTDDPLNHSGRGIRQEQDRAVGTTSHSAGYRTEDTGHQLFLFQSSQNDQVRARFPRLMADHLVGATILRYQGTTVKNFGTMP